tara:strand:- start:112 stop:1053 length:942 start_codon:yes stop_codon:yes gene_type:complete
MAEPRYRIKKPIMGQNRPVVRDGRSGSQNDDTQRKSLQTAQDSLNTEELQHSPLGELLFGNRGITPEQIGNIAETLSFGLVDSWKGADDPIEWLESLANNVPLGEYFVPTTKRDLTGDTVLALLTGGMGNQALTGRAVSRPFVGKSRLPGEFGLGPRVSDKLAELLPGQTASSLIDPTNPNLSASIAQTIFPNRTISGPRIARHGEQTITPRVGRLDDATGRPVNFQDITQTSVDFGSNQSRAARQLAQREARKLRAPGASSIQRRAGRHRLENLPAVDPEPPVPDIVRRRRNRARRITGEDRSLLKSFGIRE